MLINCAPAAAVEVVRSLENLNALGQLLNCADPGRWNSLARPEAAGIAGLIFQVHADLNAAVAEILDQTSST